MFNNLKKYKNVFFSSVRKCIIMTLENPKLRLTQINIKYI